MRFFILDDHPMIRSGLAAILMQDGHDVPFQADSLGKARNYLLGDWDIGIFDLNLPDGDGLALIREIRSIGITKPIIIFSMETEESATQLAWAAGANGFVFKGDDPVEIYQAILKINCGKRYMSPSTLERMSERIFNGKNQSTDSALSPRETEVLRLIGKGMSTKEMAEELKCTTNTIATFRHRIIKKLELSSTTDLIRYALKNR